MEPIIAAFLNQLRDSLVQTSLVAGAVLLLVRFAKVQPAWPTFAFILLPVPLIALTLFFPWLNGFFSLYTPILMLVLLLDGFLLSTSMDAIALSRSLNRKFSIGQPNTVSLTVINTSGDVVYAQVRDSIPSALRTKQSLKALTFTLTIPPYGQQEVSYELQPERRGIFRFEKVHLRYRSRLGLLWRMVQGGRPETIQVMPDLRRLRQLRVMASQAQNAGELQKRSLGLEGTQFIGLRHYFAGDDIKKIAWQATAKLDAPVVRTFAHEVEQPILVLMDAGRKMDVPVRATSGRCLKKYDWALNAALAFTGVAIDRGDCVGGGVFSNKVLWEVPLGSGRHHLNRILDTLGNTDVQAVEPDYEAVMLQFARGLKRRSLVVIFTDLIDPLASRALLNSLRSFSKNHLLMIVTLADQETCRYADTMPSSPDEAYKKGVALDLLEMRRQTLSALTKVNRAIVIDAPPEALDETLIQQYLQLKRKNRI